MSDEVVSAGSDEPSGEDERTARRAAQDEVVVEALAHGFSYPEAAAFAGVVAKTVGRRMEKQAFRRRVSLRRAEVVGQQTGLLVSGSHEAIGALQDEMRTAPRSVDRTRAAGLLLGYALRFRHAFELEARLRAVESRLGLVAAGDVDDADVDDDARDSDEQDDERDAAFQRDRDDYGGTDR